MCDQFSNKPASKQHGACGANMRNTLKKNSNTWQKREDTTQTAVDSDIYV